MKLHDQVTHYKDKCAAYEIALDSILSYVCSPKYQNDTSCNVNDIVLRIRERKRAIQIVYTDKE